MRRLFYFILALPLMFVACEENVPTVPEVKEPILKLTSDAIEVKAEAGSYEITYTLENKKEGVELTAECAAEWITDLVASDKVTFNVVANEGEAREAKITLKYDTLSFDVAVKQAAKGDEGAKPIVEGWAIVGSMTNNWDEYSAIAMTEVEGYYAAYGIELTTEDSFAFIENSDFNSTRRGNGVPAEADYGYLALATGSDIRVKEAGKYDIYLAKELDVYYLMSEGKDPEEGIEPEKPVLTTTYAVLGNFVQGDEVELVKQRRLWVAQDLVFAEDGELSFMIRKNNNTNPASNYGVRTTKVRSVGEEIDLFSGEDKGTKNVAVDAERGVKYDLYFNPNELKVWLMPDGQEPEIEIVFNTVTGVFLEYPYNFGIFMVSGTIDFYLDFNCPMPCNDSIIPEATYYVNDTEKTGYNFNELGNFTVIKMYGFDTFPVDGTMVIKHIPGGYDITIDMITAQQEEVKAHYAGPLLYDQYMGREVVNPQ